MLAYLEGDNSATINIHHRDGYQSNMPVKVFFRTEEELSPIEAYALELCRGKILDVGAGAGCHSLVLNESDYEVHSIDIDQNSCHIMRKSGLKSVCCTNFLDHKTNLKYDTILFLMNGIGIAQKLDQLDRYLNHCIQLLKPNGQILLDSSDLNNGQIQSDQNHYHGEVDYQLSYKDQYGEPYTWLYLDQKTLTTYAAKSGLRCQIIYEEDDGSFLARLFKEAL